MAAGSSHPGGGRQFYTALKGISSMEVSNYWFSAAPPPSLLSGAPPPFDPLILEEYSNIEHPPTVV